MGSISKQEIDDMAQLLCECLVFKFEQFSIIPWCYFEPNMLLKADLNLKYSLCPFSVSVWTMKYWKINSHLKVHSTNKAEDVGLCNYLFFNLYLRRKKLTELSKTDACSLSRSISFGAYKYVCVCVYQVCLEFQAQLCGRCPV